METTDFEPLLLPGEVVTRRLVLRQPSERDIPCVVRELGNLAVSRWLGRAPHPYVPKHARAWLGLQRYYRDEGRDLTFVITTRRQVATVIGGIGCHDIHSDSPVVGYWLGERHWGRGYVSEALAAVLGLVATINPEARVHATVLPDNQASMRVLRKAGFRRQTGTTYLESRSLRRHVAVVRFLAAPARPV